MLSICIPVYNVDITHLVNSIIKQADTIELNIELIIIDDGSSEKFKEMNAIIKQYPCVKYIEQKSNSGSATMRNQLAKQSSFKNILFIDSDSEIPIDYLAKYQKHLTPNLTVVCGGRVHDTKYLNRNTILRFKVGRYREDYDASKRNIIPNQSFMSNNFLIKKEVFNRFKFDETIKLSGHEDTLFGIELEKNGILIEHIDNQIIHTGLEENQYFITKTEQRLVTLQKIEKQYIDEELIYNRIKILKFYKRLKKLKLLPVVNMAYHLLKKPVTKQLLGNEPNLYLYDFYKLGYYSHINKKTTV